MEELRDTIAVLGSPEEKLLRLLAKLGYRLEQANEKTPLSTLLDTRVVDLILIAADSVPEFRDIVAHLRQDEATRRTPVVISGISAALMKELATEKVDKCEFIPQGAPIASVSVKVATLLRLRKMAGGDSQSASVGEANAMLRDLNTRFQKELEEAKKIQLGLLPRVLPKGSGFDLAVTYQPLDGVGGDWYFVREVPGEKLSIQIADVTGHGLSAAFICSMTKLALTAVVQGGGIQNGSAGGAGVELDREQPEVLLERMNSLLAPQLPDERFVTAATLRYHPASGALEYARAGHPPAILFRRSDSSFSELKGSGFALGFMDEAQYVPVSEKLAPGDLLVLYTDGITEAQNRSLELYGTERLVKVLQRSTGEMSAEQVLQSMLEDFTAFSDGRILKDDVTVVVLKRVS